MKVGITRTQLAGAAIARLQANSLLSSLFFVFFFFTRLWSNEPIVLPIHLVGKLVFVEATVNGVKGHFLFDTGAENLMLNSQYFNSSKAVSLKSEVMGFDGQVLPTSVEWTESIQLGDLHLPNVYAVLLDLSAMEKIKNLPIHGIIGHALLKNTVWKLDFECKELTISKPDKRNKNEWSFSTPSTDSVDLLFAGHLPYLFVHINGKRLRMAFDTGSERNLLQIGAVHEQHFTQRGKIKIASMTSEASHLRVGFVPNFSIERLQADSLEVVLTDLWNFNQELCARLDGVLGNTFFMEGQIAIDYRRRKAYFWRRPENVVHLNIAYENAP